MQKAKIDLEKILGRKPTPAEIAKFVKAMPSTRHYSENDSVFGSLGEGWS